MRRVSAKRVKAGMVLARDIYSNEGFLLHRMGAMLGAKDINQLQESSLAEVIIHDDRMDDVMVSPMFPPELESHASDALKNLMIADGDRKRLDLPLIDGIGEQIRPMVQRLFPEPLGEISAIGCASIETYSFIQPAKTAGLAVLIGKRLGLALSDLESLGMAAMLKDTGYIVLSNETGEELGNVPKPNKAHPLHGARLLKQSDGIGDDVVRAVLEHHERWDGSGFPNGTRGEYISTYARILAITDSYYDLVSVHPNRRALMPHEAVEFIMAFSGEAFDPKLVQMFARQIPLYPTGVMVRLNTGLTGIVSEANLGQIGRPVVRICYEVDGQAVEKPYDMDLSLADNQRHLISEVVEY